MASRICSVTRMISVLRAVISNCYRRNQNRLLLRKKWVPKNDQEMGSKRPPLLKENAIVILLPLDSNANYQRFFRFNCYLLFFGIIRSIYKKPLKRSKNYLKIFS